MCPFRITWCIAPEGDPRGSPARGTGKAWDHRCVAMIRAVRNRHYRYGTVSYRNLIRAAPVIQVTFRLRPWLAAGPAPALFLISPNGPWCLFPGSAGLREQVGLTEHAGGRVDDQGQGERGVLADQFHGDRGAAVAGL